jgi:hypothetical protein
MDRVHDAAESRSRSKGLLVVAAELETTHSLAIFAHAMPEDPNSYFLFCWILGQPLDHIFRIQIATDKSVWDLKNLIHEHPDLATTPVHSLTLWHVSIEAADLDAVLGEGPESIKDARKLQPLHLLCNVFSKPYKKQNLHIIIQRPGM